jgi:predicted 3-demethylubiquinone-9 3-methyltransferase (glyoxalase superfamily)
MAKTVSTHLMFTGQCEEAITWYVSLIPGSQLTSINRYGPGQPGKEGSVHIATFHLKGTPFIAIDSPVKHAFGFTASTSIFVDCESEAELDGLVAKLGEGGQTFMPPGNYGFSRKFAWVADRFGVSWQINWP